MTRISIEHTYKVLREGLPKYLPLLHTTIHNIDGQLCPGLAYFYEEEDERCGNVMNSGMKMVHWKCKKQLTIEELLKISKIWTELIDLE